MVTVGIPGNSPDIPNYATNYIGFRLEIPLSLSVPESVPEIDPAAGSSALALVAGVLAIFEPRRRRGCVAARAG